MPPVTKCYISPHGHPSFDWLFTPSTSDLSAAALQRSEYCDNSTFTFAAPHSFSQRLTSEVHHKPRNTPVTHHSMKDMFQRTGDTEEFLTDANSDLSMKQEFSRPMEQCSDSPVIMQPSELKRETQVSEKPPIGNTTMKFLHQIGMTIIGHRKHVLSNFDMNAISPTSW